MQQVLNWAVPAAFIIHGIGMIGGVYFVFTTKSWFGEMFGDAIIVARIITAIIWIVSGVAYIAAGWGYWHDLEWWRTAAWIAAPTTLAGIALWWGVIPPGTYVGAWISGALIAALIFGWL